MAHNIDMSNGQANMAFRGERSDIWHRLGQEMEAGMSMAQWAKRAGLDWTAVKVPAIPSLEGAQFDHIAPAHRIRAVPYRKFIVRSDTGAALGYVSDIYKPVQPVEVLEWFERYIGVDDRFELDVAGSLGGGEQIWATATFRDPLSIAGDRHVARVLMTTTYDGTGSTINQGTMVRTVCNNTLNMALADKRAVVRTRHNTTFDAKKVGDELAAIAQGFAEYKKIGDALALNKITAKEVSDFFKECLDIPLEAKKEEISTRKMNQFEAVKGAYRVTQENEGARGAWAALQAITRYVDHDRTSGTDEKVFSTSQFGSGAAMKATAMGLLLPRIADKVALPV